MKRLTRAGLEALMGKKFLPRTSRGDMKICSSRSRLGKDGKPLEGGIVVDILVFLHNKGFKVGKTKTVGIMRNGRYCRDKYLFVGFPDITAFGMIKGKYSLMFIECKRHDGTPSKEQLEFQSECEKAGVIYIIARSVEDIKKEVG